MGESKSVHDHRVKKTPKDYTWYRGGERETKTCIKVITGSSYSPAHFWCWWVAAIMHTIIWCCLFYKLDWLHFSWKTTKLVLIGTRHKQWWPFFLCKFMFGSKPTVASIFGLNSLKLSTLKKLYQLARAKFYSKVNFLRQDLGYSLNFLMHFVLAAVK